MRQTWRSVRHAYSSTHIRVGESLGKFENLAFTEADLMLEEEVVCWLDGAFEAAVSLEVVIAPVRRIDASLDEEAGCCIVVIMGRINLAVLVCKEARVVAFGDNNGGDLECRS